MCDPHLGIDSRCKVIPCETACVLPDSAYPARLAARLKLPLVNLGVPGATTRDGLLRLPEALGHDPALALVELGANDMFQGVATAEARANLTAIIEGFRREIPGYMLRHTVKAGMTGWAQVHGWRGDTSLHERVEHDIFYIQNWSLALDLRILLMTFWRGHRNAY